MRYLISGVYTHRIQSGGGDGIRSPRQFFFAGECFPCSVNTNSVYVEDCIIAAATYTLTHMMGKNFPTLGLCKSPDCRSNQAIL